MTRLSDGAHWCGQPIAEMNREALLDVIDSLMGDLANSQMMFEQMAQLSERAARRCEVDRPRIMLEFRL